MSEYCEGGESKQSLLKPNPHVRVSHFAQQLEKDEVPLLKLGGLLALRGPREPDASCPVRHHVALHQQLVVCNGGRKTA